MEFNPWQLNTKKNFSMEVWLNIVQDQMCKSCCKMRTPLLENQYIKILDSICCCPYAKSFHLIASFICSNEVSFFDISRSNLLNEVLQHSMDKIVLSSCKYKFCCNTSYPWLFISMRYLWDHLICYISQIISTLNSTLNYMFSWLYKKKKNLISNPLLVGDISNASLGWQY